MNVKKAISKLIYDFETISDAAYGDKMSAYMKHHFQFYGVRSPQRKELEKEQRAYWKKFSKEEIILYASSLWEAPHREMQYTALEAMKYRVKLFDPSDMSFVENLIVSKSWWDTVDSLAPNIAGMLFFKYPEIQLEWIEKWNEHENMWLNRSAIISQLRYKDKVDLDLLFALVESHIGAKEFFINKACGWALREASKKYPAQVRTFINDHEKLSNLTRKEGSKYL